MNDAVECDQRFQSWKNYRGQTDEEGFAWPSLSSIRKAVKILSDLTDLPMPMFMAPDGEGGISLEWRSGNNAKRVLIDSDGGVIQRMFRDSRLLKEKN